MKSNFYQKRFLITLSLLLLFMVGCDNMRDGSRLKPLEKSDFFEDGSSSRPLVEGTVPRGHLEADDHLYRGKVEGKFAETFPFEITEEDLLRGQERYNIYCSVCHDKLGNGMGMVVKRGFKKPPSLHDDRLRNAPPGYFFNVISNGFGSMAGYKGEISAEDRWKVIAYLKTLQLSQNTKFGDLSKEEKNKVKEAH